jgi:predicted dehydrogenase
MQNYDDDRGFVVLLTGAGSIARRHANNLRALRPGLRLYFVASSDSTRAWVDQFGGKAVASVEEGLIFQPQLAVVCSSSALHARDLALLMPQVQALYIEKPVVTDEDGLRQLERALAVGWTRPSVVGCNLRYLGVMEKVKVALQAGVVGRACSASLRVGQWLPEWRPGRDWRMTYSAYRSRGGGVIFDLVHELDSASNLFGEIAQGQAAAASLSSLEIAADDSAAIVLMMKSGLPVQVVMDYVSRVAVREYTVVGDQATLRLDLIGRRLTVTGPNCNSVVETVNSDWDMEGTYRSAMRDLLDSWTEGRTTRFSLGDAMHTIRWMLYLERNAWRKATFS